jgi:MYXO-CTERM domain-containing protein
MRTHAALLSLATLVALGGASPPVRAVPCVELPVMMLVIDRSNSMWGVPNAAVCAADSCPRKWGIASAVLPDVANRFRGGFRFASMLYPATSGGDLSCGTGLVDLPISATPEDIQVLLQSYGPVGATPTAASLVAAKTYLQGLNLTTNAYVLLVTDGVPNCNPALNQATCSCTVSSCVDRANGDRCLDDVASAQAAAALYQAGFRVFVTGFGDTVNLDNNAAVLNAVAAAGGTTAAYNALDAASLEQALSGIMGQVNECCQDACTVGAASCAPSGASRTICRMGSEGCSVWQTENCAAGSVCNPTTNTCESCATTCVAGRTQCDGTGQLKTCVADARGCTSWQVTACPSGTQCNGGSCTACNTTCTAGQQECVGNGTRTCVADARGCTSWGSTTPCQYGTLCAAGQCQNCTADCAVGSLQCVDTANRRECWADENGCTKWRHQACPNGESCAGGTCAPCNGCTLGERRCAGQTTQLCAQDGQGCTVWTDGPVCLAPQFCTNGICLQCPDECTAGARECQGSRVRACVRNASGCLVWQDLTECVPPDQCLNGGCCADVCELGQLSCANPTTPRSCVPMASGCRGWEDGEPCADGSGCVAGTCRLNCNPSGEGDDCPDGYECLPDENGAHCVPEVARDAGPVGSSSSGGLGTSGGAGGLGGDGTEDEEVPNNPCGCASTSQGNAPALLGAAFLLAALLSLRRRAPRA